MKEIDNNLSLAGRWEGSVAEKHYMIKIPFKAVREMAGFPVPPYHPDRNCFAPSEECQIFPEIEHYEGELRKVSSHPDYAAFWLITLLKWLRKVLLQDTAYIMMHHPDYLKHPVFEHAIFASEVMSKFAETHKAAIGSSPPYETSQNLRAHQAEIASNLSQNQQQVTSQAAGFHAEMLQRHQELNPANHPQKEQLNRMAVKINEVSRSVNDIRLGRLQAAQAEMTVLTNGINSQQDPSPSDGIRVRHAPSSHASEVSNEERPNSNTNIILREDPTTTLQTSSIPAPQVWFNATIESVHEAYNEWYNGVNDYLSIKSLEENEKANNDTSWRKGATARQTKSKYEYLRRRRQVIQLFDKKVAEGMSLDNTLNEVELLRDNKELNSFFNPKKAKPTNAVAL
ncbi:hypothetical protein SeLEV6574_g06826 [Synchytrium endobioticum]|uniref:Ndc10 domain-containing protein n=1 Tax=Synchytrium endobioticum TaxID=286115 RepID=A0A507CK08_9FUNG|nr:hypothetical protein SeLEV6574_g06826 [Synchytrium endobioticum]